jgi:alpha-L-rhamnosidase
MQAFSGNPGWADAGVILPWRVYLQYGDTQALREQFVAARSWVDFVHRHNPDLIWKNRRSCGTEYGDWLNGDRVRLEDYPRTGAEVPRGLFATAFFALSADLVCRMAVVLGYGQDAQTYGHLAQRIRQAFNTAFVAADGGIDGETQAGYVLALAFDLLPVELRGAAAAKLTAAIAAYRNRVSTGIQTTGLLMQVLSAFGYDDVAWDLLMNRQAPSWLYMVGQGATTIWERWDGFVAGRGFADPGMNSFNHCALGAVGEWMVRNVIGIGSDPALPGFRRAVIRPVPGGGVTWAEGSYKAITGRIYCRWELAPEGFTLKVELPPNVPGVVYLPAPNAESVTEGGKAVAKAKNVTWLGQAGVYTVFSVESGQYEFAVPVAG